MRICSRLELQSRVSCRTGGLRGATLSRGILAIIFVSNGIRQPEHSMRSAPHVTGTASSAVQQSITVAAPREVNGRVNAMCVANDLPLHHPGEWHLNSWPH